MVDLAKHYEKGIVQLGDIAKRQGISLKYLEQIIIPLKKANLIRSVRGAKGGHMLARPPEEITVADIVGLMEGGAIFSFCLQNPENCDRADTCVTRDLWKETEKIVYNKLSSVTLSDLALMEPCPGGLRSRIDD
jgi:Rrf2 family protein